MADSKKHTPSDLTQLPSLEQVTAERERITRLGKFRKTLISTIAVLIVVAAVAILISTLWLPVLQIYGNSMTPTFESDEIVVLTKNKDFDTGDIVAFYYNNKILVKRVIGKPGDWINIDEDGNVFVNDVALYEPYVTEKSFEDCDIELPYQVPDNAFFVMGDHRSISVDSRTSTVGCIRKEEIVGQVVLRVWPLNRLSLMS